MEAADRKMSLIFMLITLSNIYFIWMAWSARRQSNKELLSLYKAIEEISVKDLRILKQTTGLCENSSKFLNSIDRIYLIIDILKLSSSYAIQSTVVNILKSDKVPSSRDACIILLNNLVTEYNAGILDLKNKIVLSDNAIEKEKINKVINELEGLSTLISSISSDSSDEYLNQMYREVFKSMAKIKNI